MTTQDKKHKHGEILLADEDWPAYCEGKMALPGYICLAVMPRDEWYTGLVERSFSIGTDTRAT